MSSAKKLQLSSESQALTSVLRKQALGEHITESEAYLAAILSANSGHVSDLEVGLDRSSQNLLQLRRSLKEGDAQSVQALFKELEAQDLDSIQRGDLHFINGVWQHGQGNLAGARSEMHRAVKIFEDASWSHRSLRALINSEICTQQVQSYQAGKLHALVQQARRSEHWDLVGNVLKSHAVELCARGELQEADSVLKQAIEAYGLDGCAEDLSLSWALTSLIAALKQDFDRAKEAAAHVVVLGGKVEPYMRAVSAVFAGNEPSFPEGHVLANAEWRRWMSKTQSVPGRIAQLISEKPRGRDELIGLVWEGEEWSPALVARLHSAVNYARKKLQLPIVYDGKNYSL